MIWNHKRVLRQLKQAGWAIVGCAYSETFLKAPDGRLGRLPWANRPTRAWSQPMWARVKRDLHLHGKEIYG